jgi:tRNA pseudouridine55 synthase
MPNGFLNLHKPEGFTSHDCVALVRKVYHTRKVGHGGTLDPAATGVLPIAVGQATRFLSFLSGQKRYQATFRLGAVSDTDDATGQISLSEQSLLDSIRGLDPLAIQASLSQFEGTIDQVPPLYSAVKQQGQKLYQLARQGILATDLQIPARQVTIDRIQLLHWRPDLPLPELDVDIECGSGTYIRAIARDLGQRLGCGGLMSHLIRSQSGPFELTQSIPLADLRQSTDPVQVLQPIEQVFSTLSVVTLDPDLSWRWTCGQGIPLTLLEDINRLSLSPEPVRVQRDPNLFLGLGRVEEGQLKALRVLSS